MVGPNYDVIEERILQRKVNRELGHAIEHIKNRQYELAINILTSSLKRERATARKEDKE